MKIRAFVAAAVLFGLGVASPVQAAPISDTVDPNPNILITAGSTPSCPAGFTCGVSTVSFVHDITDNGFSLLDTITSATVAVHLTEQVVTGPNNETYQFTIGVAAQTFGCSSGNCVPNPGVTDTIILNVPSLADLQADGKIGVTVQALTGNFLFADSVLTAEVTPFVARVPVPSSLFLLGFGLAILMARFRRDI